jgi:hypothetical protein
MTKTRWPTIRKPDHLGLGPKSTIQNPDKSGIRKVNVFKSNVNNLQVIDQGPSNELQRREGYWQHELMTLLPWGLNIRDELNGGIDIQVK